MPVTIYALALKRLDLPADTSSLNGQQLIDAGLPMLGGCEGCGATIAAYNAHPSRTGFLRCGDCIGDLGYPTVEHADAELFGPSPEPEPDDPAAVLADALERLIGATHDVSPDPDDYDTHDGWLAANNRLAVAIDRARAALDAHDQ